MVRPTKKPKRYSPRNLALISIVTVASLSYVAYYSQLTLQTHSDSSDENRSLTTSSDDFVSDKDYVAYALKLEERSKRERGRHRRVSDESAQTQFHSEPLYDRYVAELQASLDLIPLDQPGLRQPLEERLKNARDE